MSFHYYDQRWDAIRAALDSNPDALRQFNELLECTCSMRKSAQSAVKFMDDYAHESWSINHLRQTYGQELIVVADAIDSLTSIK